MVDNGVSIVVPLYRDRNIFKLIESYKDIKNLDNTELIIIGDRHDDLIDKIRESIDSSDRIKVIEINEKERTAKKDAGCRVARYNWISFIDQDCRLSPDYVTVVLKILYKMDIRHIIRGKVIFEFGRSLASRLNAFNKQYCNDILFRSQAFTPNLIMHKQILEEVGGWQLDSIEEQDDYILSERLSDIGINDIVHFNNLLIYHKEDVSFKKNMIGNFGYGLGYGYRFHRRSAIEGFRIQNIIRYMPPFGFSIHVGILYFSYRFLEWLFLFFGYLSGIVRYNWRRSA